MYWTFPLMEVRLHFHRQRRHQGMGMGASSRNRPQLQPQHRRHHVAFRSPMMPAVTSPRTTTNVLPLLLLPHLLLPTQTGMMLLWLLLLELPMQCWLATRPNGTLRTPMRTSSMISYRNDHKTPPAPSSLFPRQQSQQINSNITIMVGVVDLRHPRTTEEGTRNSPSRPRLFHRHKQLELPQVVAFSSTNTHPPTILMAILPSII